MAELNSVPKAKTGILSFILGWVAIGIVAAFRDATTVALVAMCLGALSTLTYYVLLYIDHQVQHYFISKGMH